jgi:putative SOS response-associated peptidase YedK
MQQAFGLNIPQTLEDICDPTRLALVVHDRHSGSRSLNPLRLRRGTHSVVRERPVCRSKNARMVSARSETANTKPAFRDALKSRSRLIAADAIYWGCADAHWKTKQPYYFGKRRRFVRVHWNQRPLERHHLFPLSS